MMMKGIEYFTSTCSPYLLEQAMEEYQEFLLSWLALLWHYIPKDQLVALEILKTQISQQAQELLIHD